MFVFQKTFMLKKKKVVMTLLPKMHVNSFLKDDLIVGPLVISGRALLMSVVVLV